MTAFTVTDTVVFIVQLPTNNMRILTKAFRHSGHDAARSKMEFRRVHTIMAAVAELYALSAFIDSQNVRVLLHQPGRWSCRRRPEYGRNSRGCKLGNGISQPVKIELPNSRFHGRPGKFSHACHRKSSFLHQADIVRPVGSVPVFRIVR